MKQVILFAAVLLASTPALAGFECPVGKGASIYDGAPGAKLMAEPNSGARVITRIDPIAAVAVLETMPACKLPKGWMRADHNGHSGYIREADLRPRVSFGMPE